MLIRVTPNLYLNSDDISSILFSDGDNADALVQMRSGKHWYGISESTARGLLEFLEVNEALTLDDTSPPAADLRTKIAIALRDTWKGASLEQLEAIFYAGIPAIKLALADLEAEQVIIQIDNLYYHTSSNEAQTYLRKQRLLSLVHILRPNVPGKTYCGFYSLSDRFRAVAVFPEIKELVIASATCADCLTLFATPSPDPSSEGAALPDEAHPVVADSDSTIAPKSES